MGLSSESSPWSKEGQTKGTERDQLSGSNDFDLGVRYCCKFLRARELIHA